MMSTYKPSNKIPYKKKMSAIEKKNNRPKANRDKGRKGEFWMRLLIARTQQIYPSNINMRAKSAPGCDLWVGHSAKTKFPFCVEVKNRQKLSIATVMEQTVANTFDDNIPLALVKLPTGEFAILCMEDFFALIRTLNTLNSNWFEIYKECRQFVMEHISPFTDAKANIPDYIIEIEGDDYERKEV